MQGSGTDLGLARVDPGGSHPDQDVQRAERTRLDVLDAEHLEVSVTMETYGFHGQPFGSAGKLMLAPWSRT
ncbi:hypothetical protein GCM10010331_24920 [Streptomyces xanthochromogenes]|nr:hypothetical protein GCM10010331_24920 [Streptomyces xanthochromogenes]